MKDDNTASNPRRCDHPHVFPLIRHRALKLGICLNCGEQQYEVEGDSDELSPEQEAEHHEVVRRVADEHGFPLSDWQPRTPT